MQLSYCTAPGTVCAVGGLGSHVIVYLPQLEGAVFTQDDDDDDDDDDDASGGGGGGGFVIWLHVHTLGLCL